MSWFKRRKKRSVPEASRVGIVNTVLAKLGFDLRGYYEDLIHEPLPEEFRKSLNAVSSQERQTGELITPSGEHLKSGVSGVTRHRRAAR